MEQNHFVMNKRGSDDSLSCNEWTIIDEESDEKVQEGSVIQSENKGYTDSNDSNNSDDSNDTDACYNETKKIQDLPKFNENESIEIEGEEFIEKQMEESDGISVITESEAEQNIIDKRFGQIGRCENLLSGMLKKYEKPSNKPALQVGNILNVMIACSLAAIIGLGAGRILSMDDKCPVSSDIDFNTIRSENNVLIDQLKELSEVKNVLDEIKASIPQMKTLEQERYKGQVERTPKKIKMFKDSIKISDTYSFDPDTDFFKQLQKSLNTLCSVIDQIYRTEKPLKTNMFKTQNVIIDLMTVKKLVERVIEEMDDVKKTIGIRFLQEIEDKIENICQSLLLDLSHAMHRLMMKFHHKLNKVKEKLNKRLCFLRNTESDDSKFLKSLKVNNTFLESCNKILNVTLKSRDKSAEIKKSKDTKDQNISQKYVKINKRNSNKFASKLKNSNDDSSVPDFTYNHDDFWKNSKTRKRSDRLQRVNTDETALDKLNSQEDQNVKCTKSANRCLKNMILDTLLPVDICPLPQNPSFRVELVYAKSKEAKTLVSDSTPLTMLKPSHSTVESGKNSTKVKEVPKWRTIDDIETEHWTALSEIQKEERDFMKEADANTERSSTESRHDVSPSVSGINVQAVKKSKKRWSEEEIVQKTHNVIRRDDAVKVVALERATKDSQRSNDFNSPITPSKEQETYEREKQDSNVTTNYVEMSMKRTVESNYNGKKHVSSSYSEKNTKEKVSKQKGKKVENIGRVNCKVKKPRKLTFSEAEEKEYKKKKSLHVKNDALNGEWQLQRSRARKELRDRERESEWIFDRADSRRNARKNMSDTRFYTTEKCPLFITKDLYEEESHDYWSDRKDMNTQKYSSNRAEYTEKKFAKMPHRQNIFQVKRR